MGEWKEGSKGGHKWQVRGIDTVVVQQELVSYVPRPKLLSGKLVSGRQRLCTREDQVNRRTRKEVPMIQGRSRNQMVSTEEIQDIYSWFN